MAANSQNIIGSSLSIWGENIRNIPTNEIEQRSPALLRAMSEKTREAH